MTRLHARRAAAAGQSAEAFQREFGRGAMLGRPGTPGQVAAAIAFLASDDASCVTPATLMVDGGQSALAPDARRP